MKLLVTFLLFLTLATSHAQTQQNYEQAYLQLQQMLEGKRPLSIQKAIFAVENAWHGNTLSYLEFDKDVEKAADACQQMIMKKGLGSYKTAGNWAIFMYMTQEVPENNGQKCTYNFEDFLGRTDYANTFVTRAAQSKKGNCLSLPLLYKCIADKIGAEAKLTLGPYHTWIRHINEEGGWTNVELTSGQLPSDGLMMTELGITMQAVKSGAYFKPLSDRETVAFLLTQLSNAYENSFNKLDDFTDKCAELSLKYYPSNPHAYMIKLNHMAKLGIRLQKEGKTETALFKENHKAYLLYAQKLSNLGISGDFQDKAYNEWIKSMQDRKE
ncbi:MAG: hypothetical protein AAF740_12975 [Bacteroidota bacterium]